MAKHTSSKIGGIVGVLAGLAGFTLVAVYPFLIGALLVLLVSTGLGSWYGAWYAKKGSHSKTVLNILFWSNVITWIVPLVGFFTSSATFQINARNHGADRRQFMIIAGICYGLSLINGFFGVKLALGI